MSGRARRRLRQVGLTLAALVGIVAGGLGAFRVWVRAAPPPDAPVVLLAIGADLINDVGLHQAAYQATLTRLGARVIEVSPRDARRAAELLDGVDALVLTGGGDVDPARYGGDPQAAHAADPRRDAFEEALIREALARDVPLLAVCRGHQLLNVVFGGTLRDVRDDPALARRHGITAHSLAAHPVRLSPGTVLSRRVPAARTLQVSSFHGQVVDAVGPGLRVAARAPDGVVEALEVEGERFALSVQWHPELASGGDPVAHALFGALLDEARRRRRAGSVAPGDQREGSAAAIASSSPGRANGLRRNWQPGTSSPSTSSGG